MDMKPEQMNTNDNLTNEQNNQESGVYEREGVEYAVETPVSRTQDFEHEQSIVLKGNEKIESELMDVVNRMTKLQKHRNELEPGSVQRIRADLQMREYRREANKLLKQISDKTELVNHFLAKINSIIESNFSKTETERVEPLTQSEMDVLRRGIDEINNPQANNSKTGRINKIFN